MRKGLFTCVSICLILLANGQSVSSAKAVEVTNYKEVLSQIEYPQKCKEEGIEGKVIVSLKIDEDGKLINHEFIVSPCKMLKQAVANVLPMLRFAPAMDRYGNPMTSSITMPVNFQLTI